MHIYQIQERTCDHIIHHDHWYFSMIEVYGQIHDNHICARKRNNLQAIYWLDLRKFDYQWQFELIEEFSFAIILYFYIYQQLLLSVSWKRYSY
jgi:hypothetical protein